MSSKISFPQRLFKNASMKMKNVKVILNTVGFYKEIGKYLLLNARATYLITN